MKKFLNAGVALVGLATSGGAFAADMPVKAPPLPPAAEPTWTGPYVGVNLGAATNDWKFTDIDQFGYFLPSGPNTTFWNDHRTALTGGGQLGYNIQLRQFVIGVEGDVDVTDATSNATFVPSVYAPITGTTKMRWMSTLRGRVGFLPLPNALLYATGGWAWARFSDGWGDLNAAANGGYLSSDHIRNGGVVGGGLEYMFARHWTARLEGLYADFGSSTETAHYASGYYRTRFEHSAAIVRGGLNFKW
jgi:outer membrane immunogenic protein